MPVAPDATEVSTYIPLGCGDRLLVESQTPLGSDVLDELEKLARTMRAVLIDRNLRVSRIEIGPYWK